MNDARINELENKVVELTALVERLTTSQAETAEPSTATAVEEPTSRRGMLKVAGVAAGAAAIAVATRATPAAALHQPEDLGLGLVNTTVDKTTLNYTPGGGVTTGNGFLVQAGSGFSTDASANPAALAAWSTLNSHPTGLYAYTSASADVNEAVAAIGVGSLSYGLKVYGTRANIFVQPSSTPPPGRTDAHSAGEIVEDTSGDLWVCVGGGTPGTWRKLAGTASAGAFHAIAPARVYDSRQPIPTPGILAPNSSRVVSVKDGRNAAGTVTTADVVPAGATAIAYNITVTGATGGPNYLAVEPGNSASFVASAINFYPGADIANGSVVKLDGSRQIKVFCGDVSGSAHFIIDVVGYYL